MRLSEKGVRPGPRRCGFTLIELTIVLVAVALLIGGLLMTLTAQQEAHQVAETRARLAEVRAAVLGFAVAKGRLPCPTLPGTGGTELRDGAGARCDAGAGAFQHGFVPATTLGLAGPRDANGLLLDAWDEPIRYSVTHSDQDGDGKRDFVADYPEIQDVGLADLQPDLQVCDDAPGGANDSACGAGINPVAQNAAAVIVSLGPDRAGFFLEPLVPADELENVGEQLAPNQTAAGGLLVSGDRVFVSRGRSADPNDYFDDLLEWVPANVLYLRLIEAGRLP